MGTAAPCKTCGIEALENARFCHGCGSPITDADRHAEYKQVTVLFADVVRSMDIAAKVGAERLREIMAELADRCAAVVQRYGGTVDKFTGDGIMAVFGAPVSLEDHAVRSCLAALGIQEEAKRPAVEVQDRDGVELRLRVGLNSGQVIAGEIGSGPFGYTAVGEQVGMAQRMESVAAPGGVMLSASTARLVDRSAALGEPELVQIKGADKPVAAQRLLGMKERHRLIERVESDLVGRRWEMSAVEGLLDRAVEGHGAVVGFVGPPGIGKSRLVREVTAIAGRRGVEVFTTFCESHTSQVPFHAVARLLRATTGVDDLEGQEARHRMRDRIPDADPEDLALFDDLLGIADPKTPLPAIDPDARRRRLTALVNAASLARTQSALYVVEDAHWIDEVSESMLAEFFAVIPQTPSMVLLTYRPEYRGALTRVADAQTLALAPLSDSETAALITWLLGADPSVGALGQTIADRAAGNPFFAEEIVRELAERGVLLGETGAYIATAAGAEVSVPATLQATIAARIDRLQPDAKRTLSAAAVVGSRFGLDLLTVLGVEPVVADLVAAEFVDQVRFTGQPEYVFHHPLIRTVAYESQLKSDRADLHRRLAAAIEAREPESAEQNAALIAEHLEAAGVLHTGYGWHMRAATWAANRDIAAARLSWERAQKIADAMPADDSDQLSMRIAPRTMLCATAWQARAIQESRGRFAELRELCNAAGDKVSLAIGMTGLATELLYSGRSREGSRLVSEQMALLESIGDPTLTMGLAFPAFVNWADAGEFGELLRWSQTVIDLAAGDPAKGGGLGIGSPLAAALVYRGVARWWLGHSGWRQDLNDAVAMARNSDPATFAAVVAWAYSFAIHHGVLRADDAAVRASEEAVQTAQRAKRAVSLAKSALGGVLLYRDAAADRHRGLEIMLQMRDTWRERAPYLVPVTELWVAPERARRGDRDAAIALMRQAVDELHQAGRPFFGVWGTGVLVETLLERGGEGDLAEARGAIDRLANLSADDGSAMREITLLRLRALLTRANGDDTAYRDYRDRYRAMAKSLGFEGHMAWAEAMP
jgi:class 3 adenylate cyclase